MCACVRARSCGTDKIGGLVNGVWITGLLLPPFLSRKFKSSRSVCWSVRRRGRKGLKKIRGPPLLSTLNQMNLKKKKLFRCMFNVYLHKCTDETEDVLHTLVDIKQCYLWASYHFFCNCLLGWRGLTWQQKSVISINVQTRPLAVILGTCKLALKKKQVKKKPIKF